MPRNTPSRCSRPAACSCARCIENESILPNAPLNALPIAQTRVCHLPNRSETHSPDPPFHHSHPNRRHSAPCTALPPPFLNPPHPRFEASKAACTQPRTLSFRAQCRAASIAPPLCSIVTGTYPVTIIAQCYPAASTRDPRRDGDQGGSVRAEKSVRTTAAKDACSLS